MNIASDLRYLFQPRATAVIGASAHPEKIGRQLLENIRRSGYGGRIYPINPKASEIDGLPCHATLADIDGEIDLVSIVIPAKNVYDAVRECAEKKVRFASIITSGFSEVGNLEEERRIVALAREHGVRVLGPNIFGIYSAAAPINATFGPPDIRPGNVAIITQSGALGIAMIGKTKIENIGLSAIVSVGNKSDLDEADLLQYLVADAGTKVILMYIEGVKEGDRLVEVLHRATPIKPVIVIKSGRSKRGAMAAASHTGSLAGADEIFSDVMRQCGVNRAETIQEALDWCKFLSLSPAPQGENAVIITNGGGIGVMAADACEKYHVNLYDDAETLKEAFRPVTPEFGSTKNPVDITGQAQAKEYEAALDAAFETDAIDSIICLGCETATIDVDLLEAGLQRIHQKHDRTKPVVFSFFGGEKTEAGISRLRAAGLPIFGDVYQAVSCLGAAYLNYRNLKHAAEPAPAPFDRSVVDLAAINALVDRVRADGRAFLLAHEAWEVARAAGLAMPRSGVARNLDEAVRLAERLGYPVVMKVVSKDIIHKSDAGGVALDLDHQDEVLDAYEAILHACRAYDPRARIEGVEVSEMVKKGAETIIGARRDASFGPVVMFGLGGIYVEVMKDIAFRAWPIDRGEALAMIKDIRSYPLLLGVRGEERKDIEGIIETILRVGAVLEGCPAVSDIEVNPLVVYDQGQGVKAVDMRILLFPTKGARHA
jgi:acetyltransferase